MSQQPAGILHPAAARQRIDVGRVAAQPPVDTVVDYFWWVIWRAPEPHVQQVIPRPVVHLSAEPLDGEARLLVHGVRRARFDRRLHGDGRTVAAAFRPGGFRPLLGSDVGALRDRVVPSTDLLGRDDRSVAARLLDPDLPPADAALLLADWLAGFDVSRDRLVDDLAALVGLAESDVTITRAEHLAARAGVPLRTLQRHFSAYVGIGPKWVVQRCRLLDVAAAAHTDRPVDWAGLAAELGYADQSHLIRAFTAVVGRPPATYAAGG